MWDRIRKTMDLAGIKEGNRVKKIDLKSIKNEMLDTGYTVIKTLFPNSKKIVFAPYEEQTHSTVMIDQNYWNVLFSHANKVLSNDQSPFPG